MDFKTQLIEASLSTPHLAAEFFGVSENTIYRWLKYGAPHMALRALELRSGVDRHWYGWRIKNKEIMRPDRRIFSIEDLKNWEATLWKERMLAFEHGRQQGLRQRPPQLDLFEP